MTKQQEFIGALAAFLTSNEGAMSIRLQMDDSIAKQWATLRGIAGLHGYYSLPGDMQRAEGQIGEFLGIERAQ